MPHCAIINCKNSTKLVSVSKGGVSFHRFPHDPHLKEKWIEATGNKDWFPKKHSSICSIHFNEDDFKDINKKRRLTEEAYPTIKILKTVTTEEDMLEQTSSSKDTVFVSCPQPASGTDIPFATQHTSEQTASEKTLTPWEIKLQRKLRLAQRKIERQKVIIKRLREQNRRKDKRIFAIKAERLKTLPFMKEHLEEQE